VLLVLTVLIIGLTVFGGLAIWFRAAYALPLAVVFVAMALTGLVLLWRLALPLTAAWPGLALLAVTFGGFFVWWGSITPSATRVWATALARLPTTSIEGDRFTIHNVRNFRWRTAANPAPGTSGEEIVEERWETRTYDLARVSGVDLFFSYWTGPLIAHLLVSITFDDAPPLTFSIEIRREEGEVYSALAGFFKQYELAIIAADERDIVHLRTNVWREDVRLYRLNVSRESARKLLLAYAAELGALAAKPRWYDTLGANCTTVAFRLARQLWPGLKFDWRVLVAGRAPDYAYEIGAVRTDIPLEELKRRAAISEIARALPDGADFSAGIRAGVPSAFP
jgi:hypothetical protein